MVFVNRMGVRLDFHHDDYPNGSAVFVQGKCGSTTDGRLNEKAICMQRRYLIISVFQIQFFTTILFLRIAPGSPYDRGYIPYQCLWKRYKKWTPTPS